MGCLFLPFPDHQKLLHNVEDLYIFFLLTNIFIFFLFQLEHSQKMLLMVLLPLKNQDIGSPDGLLNVFIEHAQEGNQNLSSYLQWNDEVLK